MNPQRVGGLVLLVVGVVLFIVGIIASRSVADRWTNFFTGKFTDSTMWYMVGGIAAAVGGMALFALGSRKSSH